ncbi:vanadium-dependent haloperoxidase [Actinoplanes sp. GCM10030250]|uniref:vanadium-dependent haloperoxidase n=1 Tax=Actinoplanes sp. GCM10030250 TaxID=3273376 RepID=UPI00361BAD68
MLRRLGIVILSAILTLGGLFAAPSPARAAESTPATVYYWNDTLLELFRRSPGAAPGPLSRAGAMLHAGLFDVINTGWWAHRNWLGTGYNSNYYSGWRLFDATIDDDLAAGIFAHDMLIELFPAEQAYVAQRFADRHGTTDEHFARRLANRTFDAIMATRATDRSTADPGYTPDGVAGSWRPTGNPACTAVTPHWGQVVPFTMSSGSDYRPALPGRVTTYAALLRNSTYTSQLTEVRNLGRRDSTTRTAAQTATAHFWNNDAAGSYRTPGQLLAHTQAVAQRASFSGDGMRVSRLFAMVAQALGDAAIAAWDAKYLTAVDVWRPETAIQLHATSPDAAWRPLVTTPCSPAHVSANATLAAAWSGAAQFVVGSNSFSFTAGTEDPQAAGATRAFTSFTQAASENAVSRVYAGVNFRFATANGLTLGYDVADRVTGTRMFNLVAPGGPEG